MKEVGPDYQAENRIAQEFEAFVALDTNLVGERLMRQGRRQQAEALAWKIDLPGEDLDWLGKFAPPALRVRAAHPHTSENFLKARQALCPPKPKELLRAHVDLGLARHVGHVVQIALAGRGARS